ncbi:MAG TPA: hypothetical protein VJ201_07515 [Candidatus Babeliales bacterium]|nr:hypothetical protein [Candidatus Babeliales bacterium]
MNDTFSNFTVPVYGYYTSECIKEGAIDSVCAYQSITDQLSSYFISTGIALILLFIVLCQAWKFCRKYKDSKLLKGMDIEDFFISCTYYLLLCFSFYVSAILFFSFYGRQ